jgi:phosphoribosylformylglycinamidine cyclo-ligase
VHPLIRAGRIHALAHITGGGLPENLVRVLPDGVAAEIDTRTWTVPPEFAFVMDAGNVSRDEMFLTFNMGVGMVLVVAATEADDVVRRLNGAGEAAWIAGAVATGERTVRLSPT